MSNTSVAIAFLSVGIAPKTNLFERCLATLENNGQYKGPIFLITDGSYPQYEEMESQMTNLHIIQTSNNTAHQKLQYKKKTMKHKRHKMDFLDLIREYCQSNNIPSVETMLYLDIDILIGKPIAPFFDMSRQLKDQLNTYLDDLPTSDECVNSTNINASQPFSKPSYIMFYRTHSSPVHGGLFVADTTDSQGCLNEWASIMDETMPMMDQDALNEITLRNSDPCTRTCAIVIMEAKYHFLLAKPADMKSGAIQTFVHVTSTSAAFVIPEDVQANYFENSLGLSKELSTAVRQDEFLSWGRPKEHPMKVNT